MKTFLIVILSVVGTIVLAVGLGLVFRGSAAGGPMGGGGGPPVAVRLDTVKEDQLTEIVTAPGVIKPRTKVSISARVAARVKELPFDKGDTVKKGDTLVVLDAKELEAALRSARAMKQARVAEVKVAKARIKAQEAQKLATEASLREAERDLDRQKKLLESKDVSQATVDTAQARFDELTNQLSAAEHGLLGDQANLEVLAAGLESAEAQIEEAEEDLSYTTIHSPINGVVTRLNVEEGELVVTGTMNNAGTVLMEVADFSEMLLVAKVDETSVAQVNEEDKARVRVQAYGDDVFPGVVEYVARAETSDQDGTRYYETEILLETGDRRIFTGLSGDADIETETHENVLLVPSQAVLGRPVEGLPPEIRKAEEVDEQKTITPVVYTYVDGKAVVTPVTVGPSNQTHTIIRSGLTAGDTIIVGPYKVLETLVHEQTVIDETDPEAAKAVPPPPTPDPDDDRRRGG